MPDLWGDDGGADAFALPGDEALLAGMNAPENSGETDATPDADNAQGERPRDEHGRYVSTQEPQVEEVAAEETPAESELILGKFKSYEDLATSYTNLEQEKSRLANEVGQLRPLQDRLEQLEARVSQPQQPQYAPSDWESLIDENPAGAAELAYNQNNQAALEAAARAWNDMSPGAPKLWWDNIQLRNELNTRFSQIEQRIAPLSEAGVEQQRNQEIRQVAQEIPDLLDFVQSDGFKSILGENPLVGEAFGSTDPAKQADALRTAYHIYRGRLGDNLTEATRETARATAEGALQAREEAYVASASATASPTRASMAEQIAADWIPSSEKALADGWNI